MDFSKLKLEVYDLLGLLLPGFLLICEGWIFFRGWNGFLTSLSQITGTGLTLLFLVSFGAGNVVQELGDFAVKLIKGRRYLRRSRDMFWASVDAELVRNAIKADLGHPITTCDTAFDYCLTKIRERFEKRDLFVATSDLSRSLVVLSTFALVPVIRVAFHDLRPSIESCIGATILVAVLGIVGSLMWRRMVRFRDLSEATVFSAYLAVVHEPHNLKPEHHS